MPRLQQSRILNLATSKHLPLNTFRPRQNSRHIADILLNENIPKGPTDINSASFQIMAWHRAIIWSDYGTVYWRIRVARPQWVKNPIPYVVYYCACHDDVTKWKHFPRYWPFVRRIHRSPVNSPHKGQWRGALMFSLICVWINGWVNNREAGDLRRYRAHYYVIVMYWNVPIIFLD